MLDQKKPWLNGRMYSLGLDAPKTWLIRDSKSTGTNGGSFNSGGWIGRVLNTITASGDSGDDVTLSSNVVTLSPGYYKWQSRAPGYHCDRHQTRLFDVTNNTAVAYGSCAYSPGGASNSSQSDSIIQTFLSISVPTTYRLEHMCMSTQANNGLGIASNFAGNTEIYSTVYIKKYL